MDFLFKKCYYYNLLYLPCTPLSIFSCFPSFVKQFTHFIFCHLVPSSLPLSFSLSLPISLLFSLPSLHSFFHHIRLCECVYVCLLPLTLYFCFLLFSHLPLLCSLFSYLISIFLYLPLTYFLPYFFTQFISPR